MCVDSSPTVTRVTCLCVHLSHFPGSVTHIILGYLPGSATRSLDDVQLARSISSSSARVPLMRFQVTASGGEMMYSAEVTRLYRAKVEGTLRFGPLRAADYRKAWEDVTSACKARQHACKHSISRMGRTISVTPIEGLSDWVVPPFATLFACFRTEPCCGCNHVFEVQQYKAGEPHRCSCCNLLRKPGAQTVQEWANASLLSFRFSP